MAATATEFALDFPDALIHRILSFLTPIEAVVKKLVSKSWFRAWSTRPIIDLDESLLSALYYSSPYAEINGLAVFAKKTFRRYKHHNLKINSFILSLKSDWYCRSGLATNWTSKALKLRATDFTFRFQHPDIVIPIHAVLESENVVRRLCVEQSRIDRLKVVKCMGLKSLVLSEVEFSSASFHDLISCCPLIENLSLSRVWTKEHKDDKLEYHKQPTGSSMITLLNLTSLSMFDEKSEFQKLFLDKCLVSKFPNLKDLTLNVSLYGAAFISSSSLETLNLTVYGSSSAQLAIDVPRIRKFTFEGSVIPKFSFRSNSRDELESCVSVFNHEGLSAAWFYKLSEFLTSMEGSRIHLSLYLHSQYSFNYLAGDVECLNVCEVEDLIVDTRGIPSLSLYAVLDFLFRICHPKTITQYSRALEKKSSWYVWHNCTICDDAGVNIKSNDVTLCRVLEQGLEGKDALLPRQFMYGLRDLEELNAQKLVNEVWMPQPLDSTGDDHQRRFRFQLKWKLNIL